MNAARYVANSIRNKVRFSASCFASCRGDTGTSSALQAFVLLQPEMERRPTRVILQLGRSLTMRKTRKNYTPVEKVAILRRHLIDHVAISDLCDEHQLSPTLFYSWQKQF